MHVSKKHVYSDTKHNTTKLLTIDEFRYYKIEKAQKQNLLTVIILT